MSDAHIANEDRGAFAVGVGLTKREHACIELRIPKAGNDELNAFIREARKQEFAAMAMQGLLTNPNVIGNSPENSWASVDDSGAVKHLALKATDRLIAELEKRHD